jgi:uncharacterized membrane protein YagU involved in acid resistance
MKATASVGTEPSDFGRAIMGGFIAGTIDVGSTSLINWLNPIIILRAIASGILGEASFRDGMGSALLGLLLQWAMSIIIALIYSLAVDRLRGLRQAWVAGGLVAGVFTFLIMNFVVVPLSAVGRMPHFTASKLVANFVALLLFGLIIAFFARQHGAIRE